MKKFRKISGLIMVILALAFFFTNCEEEEEEDTPVLPTAGFIFSPTTIEVGDTVVFTNTSQNGSTYLWDFGDDATSTEENTSHIYTTAGTYVVKLTATNADGDDSTEKTLTVNEATLQLPTADFTYEPASILVGFEVTFTNTSQDGNTYLWNFGDSNTSTDENPIHTYNDTGSFIVSLIATNNDGSDTTSQTLIVSEINNVYTVDGVDYQITEAYEYISPMGGTKEWRMLGEAFPDAEGDSPVNLLKFYPVLGLGDLEGTYTFDDSEDPAVGTFFYGLTENYAGMLWDYVDMGLTGATLTFKKLNETIWEVTLVSGTLAQGNYVDWVWTANGTEFEYSVHYIGEIAPAN